MSSLAALASKGGSRGGNSNSSDGPPVKRARMEPQNVGIPFGHCLFSVLMQMHEEALKVASSSNSGSKVEIEIRVGMLVQNGRRLKAQTAAQEPKVLVYDGGPGMRFVAGVDEPFLEDMKKALLEKGFKATQLPPQRVVCDNKGNRMEVGIHGPIKGGKAIVERKERFYRKDLALLSHGYDIRMDAAYERPLEGAVANEDMASISSDEKSFTQIRLKRRTQYKIHGSGTVDFKWKVDITEVEVTHCGLNGSSDTFSRELEVEIELEDRASVEWLSMAQPDATRHYTSEMLKELMHILQICVPSDTLAFAHAADVAGACLIDLHSKPVSNLVVPMTMEVKKALNATHTHNTFVGTMPVNLSRRSLLSVQKNSYFIAEKTDGVRYLMYVVPEPSSGHPMAVLMDRKGSLFSIKGAKALGAALGINTVLDGELVYNRSLKRMVFLLFDVLLLDNEEYVSKHFESRYQAIDVKVMARYKAFFDDTSRGVPGEDKAAATPMVRKIFYPREQLASLVAKLRTEEGERVFFDGERRHWKSDGLVFQPNRPYVMAADPFLLKWKWPELRSVDLQARVSRDDKADKVVVSLWAMGPDGVYIDCTANGSCLATFDQYRLLADISEHPTHRGENAKPPVVEVVYDTNFGLWRYHMIRSDKKEPNAIHTVMGVLMELAESIPIEELEYCFGSPELLTDFARQLTKMKRQLLDWQRKRK